MIRNFKTLGLLLGALLVLGVATAPTAVAVPQFTASSYPATMTGSTLNDRLFTEAGSVECSVHYSATLSGASSTLTLTTSTSLCSAFGFISATVNPEGCTDVLHATNQVGTGLYESHVDIVCPAGNSIKISAGTCKMEIKGQNGLTTMNSVNNAGTIWFLTEMTGITYVVTQDGFACPFFGTGTKFGGERTGGEVNLSRVGGGEIGVSGS